MRGPERVGMADDVGAVFSSHNDALVKLFDAHRGLPQSFGLDGASDRMRLLFLQQPVVLRRSMIEKRLLNASKRPTGRFGDFRCWPEREVRRCPLYRRSWG